MTHPLLFTPMTIRDVTMKNRVVVAPMHQYAAENGFPTDWHLMNIGRFAAGGAGLVFVESTKVDRRGCGAVGSLVGNAWRRPKMRRVLGDSCAPSGRFGCTSVGLIRRDVGKEGGRGEVAKSSVFACEFRILNWIQQHTYGGVPRVV